MNFSPFTAFVSAGSLALTGLALQPVENSLVAAAPDFEPVRQAAAHGLLGGFRAAAADVAWLQACAAAEEYNAPAAESFLRLVTVLDPRPLYFWMNGARIMAYDIPAWQTDAAGGGHRVTEGARRRIVHDQAARALRWLDEARAFHPACAALWIERASIQLNQLGDVAGAAESYRRAWAQPDAPYFTARLYAEMLRRLGRKAEALVWLVRLHPQLPSTDESAGADLVLTRIRDLERELQIPPDQTYQPH